MKRILATLVFATIASVSIGQVKTEEQKQQQAQQQRPQLTQAQQDAINQRALIEELGALRKYRQSGFITVRNRVTGGPDQDILLNIVRDTMILDLDYNKTRVIKVGSKYFSTAQ